MEVNPSKRVHLQQQDRTLELPEDIIQHIQSFLPVTAAARTSVLSKTWSTAWSSRPNLNFNPSTFIREFSNGDYNSRFHRFVSFVSITLLRCINTKSITIHNLSFAFDFTDPRFASLLLVCIEGAVKLGTRVKEIHLSIKNFANQRHWTMQKILATKCLTKLRLEGLKNIGQLPRLDLGGGDNGINCCSLRSLSLSYVELDEGQVHNLLSCCTSMETLLLDGCTGLRNIRLPEIIFPRLDKFFISGLKSDMDEININAPNLKRFVHMVAINTVHRADGNFRINLGSQRLEYLKIYNTSITDVHLHNLLSGSPVLEQLMLEYCHKLEKIDISSPTLKGFRTISCNNLLEINLNAPSLHTITMYRRYSSTIPRFSFSKGTIPMSGQLIINVSNHVDNHLLPMLRDFISKVKNSWVDIIISHEAGVSEYNLDLEKVRAARIRLGHQVNCLKLHIYTLSELTYDVLVEGLLWVCEPKVFSMVSKMDFDIDEVNALVGQLMAKRGDESCCCKDDDFVKCRRHYFADYKVESFQRSRNDGISVGDFKISRCLSSAS